MNALQAYQDVLRELDAWRSPAFPIRSFNYFFNEAVSQYIADNYSSYDIRVKEDDDLTTVIKLSVAGQIDNSTKKLALPNDYRHFLGAKVLLKFTSAAGKYKVNDTRYHYIDRLPSAEKTPRERNAYGQPSWRNVAYQLSQNFLVLDAGSKVVFPAGDNAWLDYVSIPPQVYLNPDSSADLSDLANNSVLFFNTAVTRNHVYYEVIKLCASIFAEVTRNPRLATMIQTKANE